MKINTDIEGYQSLKSNSNSINHKGISWTNCY